MILGSNKRDVITAPSRTSCSVVTFFLMCFDVRIFFI